MKKCNKKKKKFVKKD